jgi:hypothetical protein
LIFKIYFLWKVCLEATKISLQLFVKEKSTNKNNL